MLFSLSCRSSCPHRTALDNILVFDLGGGTLDVSFVQDFEV